MPIRDIISAVRESVGIITIIAKQPHLIDESWEGLIADCFSPLSEWYEGDRESQREKSHRLSEREKSQRLSGIPKEWVDVFYKNQHNLRA